MLRDYSFMKSHNLLACNEDVQYASLRCGDYLRYVQREWLRRILSV
jgi:hypothetical protein